MFIVYSVVLSCDVWYEAQQRYASTVATQQNSTIECQSTIYRICILRIPSFYPVAFGMRRSSATPLQSFPKLNGEL